MSDYLEALAAQGDDDAGAGFYEPWRPVVGQRVRVVLNGACAFWAHQGDGPFRDYENGATATVSRLVPLEPNGGHGYEVRFDAPYPHPPGQDHPRVLGSVYAACELVPLAADPREQEG